MGKKYEFLTSLFEQFEIVEYRFLILALIWRELTFYILLSLRLVAQN